MKEAYHKGKHYVNLVRCSSKKQVDTSITDQLELLNAYAKKHGMVHAGDVLVEGVTGSVPGARRDLDELIRRKERDDDFEILLVQDTSRFTRSGAQHGGKIEYDLNAVGIKVVFVADNIPDGDHGDVIKSLLYVQAQQHAKSISMTSTRGSMSALRDGRTGHSRRAPYGTDKLYKTADGIPKCIIRLLPDGTQLQLDPASREVIGQFGSRDECGHRAYYIKQKNHQVEYVPGANDRVAVVRQIYRRHYRDAWGTRRIACQLNDEGVSSPNGGQWHVETIRLILLNPIYMGIGIANRYSSAIYHMRAPESPEPVEVDRSTLAHCRRPPRRIRPRADWVEQEHEALTDFIDEDIRALAHERHERHLQQQATGHVPVPNRDRHRRFEYFLKGILTSKQGGFPLTGRLSGSKPNRRRYYVVSRARSAPTSDAVLKKQVPADPLEKMMVSLLQMVLSSKSGIERDVRDAVQRVHSIPAQSTQDLERWKSDRDAAVRKLAFAIEHLDDTGKKVAGETLDRLQTQIRTLNRKIERFSESAGAPADADELAERVIRRLTALSENLATLPRVALHRLMETFVTRAVVDLETRDVELELTLPEWAIKGQDPMCLDSMLPWKHGNEAHRDNGFLILKPRLLWNQEWYSYGAVNFGLVA